MADVSNNTAMAVLSSLVPNSHQLLLCRNHFVRLVNALHHRISTRDMVQYSPCGDDTRRMPYNTSTRLPSSGGTAHENHLGGGNSLVRKPLWNELMSG